MMSSLEADIADLLGPVAPLPLATTEAVLPPVGSAVPAGGELAIAGGAFEGSGKFDQLGMWRPPMVSADAEIIPEKDILDARGRDMIRNDAYVGGGATLHKDNIVGAQFLLNAKPETKLLFGKEDEVWEREFQEEVETLFTLAAESPNHWFDAQRTKTLTGLVRLAVGVYTAGGEILASAEWMRDPSRPYRTAIQMIDCDRLSTPFNRQWDKDIRAGVERDRWGAPIAYHIRNSHPNDLYTGARTFAETQEWKRVEARKPWGRQMILHVFEANRPDQTRGISSMVSALMEMKMTKGFRKVELQRAVVAATYAASIESDLPSSEVLTMMGGDGAEGTDTASAALLNYLSNIEAYSGGSKNLYFDGAKIPVFMPGTKLRLQNPGTTGPMGDKFEQSLLRHIAAALGVSYEQLSRDYSQTNYSSVRAAMSETWKFMQSRKKIAADTTASFIYRLWFEEAINAGHLECLKRRNIPSFYEGLNAEAYTSCEWIGAGQGMIDPIKEAESYIKLHAAGFTTRERVIAKIHGGDWRKELRQIAREKTAEASLGLTFNADGKPSVDDAQADARPNTKEAA